MINLIVAASLNNVIGKENTLPWRLSNDLKRFKELTTSHTVIMGRKTFESIGKALPNRVNFVITSNPDNVKNDDISISSSLEEAIQTASLLSHSPEIFIIGGGQIYKEALEKGLIDRMYVTRVLTKVEGDTFFPDFSEKDWKKVDEKVNIYDGKNEYNYLFETWDKIQPVSEQ